MHGVDGWTVHPMLDDDCMMIPGDQVDTAAEGHRVGLCSTQQWFCPLAVECWILIGEVEKHVL